MSPYRYEGVPLTPAVFADLMRQTIPTGTTMARAELAKQIAAEHERRGGGAARSPSERVAKKALSEMQRAGEVEQVSHGYWRTSHALTAAQVGDVAESGPVEIGEGEETVYVYYFPAYRDQAALLGRADWPMKIGMTAGDETIRLRDQCGTAMPEMPVVGLIYRTDNARSAEKMLHAMLASRGKHLGKAPGKEWFTTSLIEVKEILDFATGQN